MCKKLLFERKMYRIFLALGLSLVLLIPGVILLALRYETEVVGVVSGLIGLLVYGALDFFLYLLLDTENYDKAMFWKNLLYYVILVVELATAILSLVNFVSNGDEFLSNLNQQGGILGIACHGFTTFSLVIKFFVYSQIANGKLLPQEALPYVSICSVVIGYLLALIISSIGLASQFVMQWVPLIVFLASAIGLIICFFIKGEIFNDNGKYNSGHTFLTKSDYSTGGYSTGGYDGDGSDLNLDCRAAIRKELEAYCYNVSGGRPVFNSYLGSASVEVSGYLDSNSYSVKLYISVEIYGSRVNTNPVKIASAAESFMSRIYQENNNRYRTQIKAIIGQAIKTYHPSYRGSYDVECSTSYNLH